LESVEGHEPKLDLSRVKIGLLSYSYEKGYWAIPGGGSGSVPESSRS